MSGARVSMLLFTCILSVERLATYPLSSDDNRPLRVVTIVSEPFARYDQYDGNLTGFIVDLLDTMAQVEKFNYTITPEPTNRYGTEKDGRWNGLIGALINRTYDVGAADLSITQAREKAVDFTVPFMRSQYRLLYNPKDKKDKKYRYLVLKNSAVEDFLRSSTNSKVYEMWTNIVAHNGFVSSKKDAVSKVLQGGYGFVCDTAATVPSLLKNSPLRFAPDILSSSWYALAVPLGSRWGHRLSVALSAVAAEGKVQELLDKYNLVPPA